MAHYVLTRWYGSLVFIGLALLALKLNQERIAVQLGGLALSYITVEALLTGELHLNPTVRRESNPGTFYFFVFQYGVVALMAFLFALLF